MARRLRPMIEREATWALGLAALGGVSLWATLPAALWLSVRTLRRKRGGDGSEPAIAVLAIGTAWISFMIGLMAMDRIMTTAAHASDRQRVWLFATGLVALATAIILLARYVLRTHPERWVARSAGVAGIVAAVAAGAIQALLPALHGGLNPVCGHSVATNADCLGSVPWLAIGPALAVGALWFVASVLTKEVARVERV